MLASLFTDSVNWRTALLAVVPTLLLAWVIARIAGRLMAHSLQRMIGEHLSMSSPLVRGPLRLVSIAVFLLAASLLIFPAFELAGMHPRTGIPVDTLTTWSFDHGLKILLIAILGYAFIRMTTLLVRRFEHQVS